MLGLRCRVCRLLVELHTGKKDPLKLDKNRMGLVIDKIYYVFYLMYVYCIGIIYNAYK